MRQHLAWPHPHRRVHPPGRAAPSTPARERAGLEKRELASRSDRSQVLKDKLAVAAVLLLVLATLTVFVLYLVQQAPHFSSGELTAFATPAPGAVGQVATNASGSTSTGSIAGAGLGRIPLILISTAVEMAIFVALGLYLRHDLKGKP
jgi:hypothetical protein